MRPGAIYVGQGGSPLVKALKWPSWTAAGAQANGYLHMQKPGCTLPTYQCPYRRFRVWVQLSRVETHHSVRYYSRMQWTYTSNHVRHVIRWKTYKGYWRYFTLVGAAPASASPSAEPAPMAASSASSAGSASPVTAYVVNSGSGTVTPIRTATNTAGTAITVGRGPFAIAITQ